MSGTIDIQKEMFIFGDRIFHHFLGAFRRFFDFLLVDRGNGMGLRQMSRFEGLLETRSLRRLPF
jgi:hypothetical protein